MHYPIPIFINARNRVTWGKLSFDQLCRLPGSHPIILDNASTWPPMTAWLATLPRQHVFRFGRNLGAYGLWEPIGRTGLRVIDQVYDRCLRRSYTASEFYVLTDDDLDYEGVPDDVLTVLRAALRVHPEVIKAGLSLRIDDLPDTYPLKSDVLHDQGQYWLEDNLFRIKISGSEVGFYRANIDTTFAMYRCVDIPKMRPHGQGKGLRAAPPYVGKHLPWYQSIDSLTDEDRFAISNSTSYTWWTKNIQDYMRARKLS